MLDSDLIELREIEAYITAENDEAVTQYFKDRDKIKALHDSVRNKKPR